MGKTLSDSYLPFKGTAGAWRRMHRLENENRQIVRTMYRLADDFKQTIAPPRAIYLAIQQVKSGTVYIRWRKRGMTGDQKYLHFSHPDGASFLKELDPAVVKIYLHFNRIALSLTLAHSLRLREVKRLKQYLNDLDQVAAAAGS